MRTTVPSRRLVVLLLATLALSANWSGAFAGVLTSDNLPTMTWSIEGAPLEAPWRFAPTLDMFAPLQGGGYQMTSSPTFDILGGRATITIETLAFDPDPFVLNNILVTNNTGSTQIFSAFVGVPTSFGAPNLISGAIDIAVIDGGTDGATAASVNPTAIYQAQIDGVTVETLLDHPFSLVAGSGGTNSADATFGPTVSGIPVNSNIGIQLRFSLTAGDTVSILSRFDVVAVPGPGAIALLGVAGLSIRARRRRT
jgi:hypothetical protein